MSKELPLFNFEGRTFDLNFMDNEIQLYAVKDMLSGIMVSQLIPATNDFIAIQGFSNFVKSCEEKKDCNVYQLIRIGGLDTEKIKLIDGEREVLFDSRDDLEKFIQEAKDFLVSNNEE